jgi:hypothetical protein
MERQKVKTYFFPVCLAKKSRQSLAFSGEKAEKPRAGRYARGRE